MDDGVVTGEGTAVSRESEASGVDDKIDDKVVAVERVLLASVIARVMKAPNAALRSQSTLDERVARASAVVKEVEEVAVEDALDEVVAQVEAGVSGARKGWASSAAAVGRAAGSFCRQASTNATSSAEKRVGGSRGAGDDTMLSMMSQNDSGGRRGVT